MRTCVQTHTHKRKKEKETYVQSKTDLINQEWRWWHGPLTRASFEGTIMASELVPSRALWRFICSKCIWMPRLAGSRAEFHLRQWDAWVLSYLARWSNSQWAGPVVKLNAPGYTKSWQPPGVKDKKQQWTLEDSGPSLYSLSNRAKQTFPYTKEISLVKQSNTALYVKV